MSAQPHFTAEIEQTVSALGAKVAKARAERGWSLQQLAARSGLSPAAIHKIEKSGMTPTITSLMKVATALGRSVGYFIEEADPLRPVTVVRRDERAQLYTSKRGLELQNVSGRYGPFFAAGAEAFVDPGADSGPEPMVHPGEELVVLLEGEMGFTVDGEDYHLEEGDSIHFRTAHPHSWRNPTDRPARAIWLAIRSAEEPGQVARLVIAFGGNALIREDERGTWPEQTVHALEAARAIARIGRADEVVLTHGNGPQVGALALQQAIGEPHAPALPLDVLDAMTQGEIGYLLQQALTAVDPSLPTATVLTRVLVADDDPAFAAEPTKPIGAFLSEDEARRVAGERGWHVAPDAGRGWRRMVPSPHPQRILEVDHVRRLAECGVLVIAAGGGGIPVTWRDGHLVGLDAVVDKDRCAAELAVSLKADMLVLVTSVPRVEIGFGTPAARVALRLTVSDALHHLDDGAFPPGSMGPKIEGATRFAGGGGTAVITDAAHLATAVRGHHGTWVVPDHDGPSVLGSAPVAAAG